jgi:WD40 repeat protein
MQHVKWHIEEDVYIIDLEERSVILFHPERVWDDRDDTLSTFSPDGRSLAWEPGDGTIRVVDLTGEGEDLVIDRFSSYCCGSLTFSPDSRRLLVVDRGGSYPETSWEKVLLDLSDLRVVYSQDVPASVEFSPDGRTLGLWNSLRTRIDLWDVERQETTRTIEGFTPAGGAINVAFTPDWQSVAYWVRGRGYLYDVATGQELFGFDGATAGFTPDSRTMITVGYWTAGDCDDNACLYDVETGSLRAILLHERILTVPGAARLSPDGRLLATVDVVRTPGYEDNFARLWDVEQGTEIVGDFRDRQNVTGAVLSPDGRYLMLVLYFEDLDSTHTEFWAVLD